MMTWSAPYNDEGVVLVKPRNIEEPYRTMAAYVSLTPTIGPWNLNYTFGVQPQWLSITVDDPRAAGGKRVTSFNGKPLFFAQLFNTFTFKGGWQLELGGAVTSKGYTQNLYLKNPYVDISAPLTSIPSRARWNCPWTGRSSPRAWISPCASIPRACREPSRCITWTP